MKRSVLALLVGCAGKGSGSDEADGFVPEPPDVARYAACTARIELDREDDGALDQVVTEAFDAVGFVAQREIDGDADGTVDVTELLSGVNRYGLISRHERVGPDGPVWVREGQHEGHLYRWTTEDDDGDGAIDLRFTFDIGDGVNHAYEADVDDDGTIEARGTYTYDAEWREVLFEYDEGADGTVDATEETTWDEPGGQSRDVVFVELDGQVGVERFEYTGDRLMSYTAEIEGTRTKRTYTYDGDSDRVLEMHQSVRYEGDLMYEEFWTYTWDAAGRETSRFYEFDWAEPGSAGQTDRTTVTWDCP